MWSKTLFFVAGVFICQQLLVLPPWPVLAVLSVFLLHVAVFRGCRSRAVGAFLCVCGGVVWAGIYGHLQTHNQLPASLIKRDLQVQGHITDIPERTADGWRFVFRTKQARFGGESVVLPDKIRLSWFNTDATLRAGQLWAFTVRLKPPAGLKNEGLFDYERWLFRHGIGATGYVSGHTLLLPLNDSAACCRLAQIRQFITDRLARYGDSDAVAVMRAITVGDKSGVSDSLWVALRKTGLNHLMAISGLHVSIVAMLFYYLSGRLWRLSSVLCSLLPAVQFQALTAIAAAFMYAGLAGFSLPTQRAFIMLLVLLGGRVMLKNMPAGSQFAAAIVCVLLYDPPAVLDAGFWLSFMAVAAIWFSTRGYARLSSFQALYRIQIAISLILLPLTLLFFAQVSLAGPLLNLLAVPLFSLTVIPASLLLVMLESTGLAEAQVIFLTQGFLQLLGIFLDYLKQLATADYAAVAFKGNTFELAVVFTTAVLILFLPVKRFAVPLAIVFLVLVLSREGSSQANTQLRITLLDVGQGLSVLVSFQQKHLLYDLGPRYRNGKSATASVVLPYLQYRNIDRLEHLVISHSDADHAGSPQAFLGQIEVAQVYLGEPHTLAGKLQTERCHAPHSWHWQDIHFEFLNPEQMTANNNNNSCVLRISRGDFSLLLTGDIEKPLENQLLKSDRQSLRALAVVIPHHGSRSSSSRQFIKAVSPGLVLNSSGFLNRYHFPDKGVEARWQENDAIFLDTATSGAIDLYIDSSGAVVKIQKQLEQQRRYWSWDRSQVDW